MFGSTLGRAAQLSLPDYQKMGKRVGLSVSSGYEWCFTEWTRSVCDWSKLPRLKRTAISVKDRHCLLFFFFFVFLQAIALLGQTFFFVVVVTLRCRLDLELLFWQTSHIAAFCFLTIFEGSWSRTTLFPLALSAEDASFLSIAP